MCQNKCAVEVTLTDGRLTDIIADPDSPKGRICPRGKLSPQMLYGEQRIQYPMIRIGEKGEGKFRRATWEEALDLIEEKGVPFLLCNTKEMFEDDWRKFAENIPICPLPSGC